MESNGLFIGNLKSTRIDDEEVVGQRFFNGETHGGSTLVMWLLVTAGGFDGF